MVHTTRHHNDSYLQNVKDPYKKPKLYDMNTSHVRPGYWNIQAYFIFVSGLQ